MEKNDEQQKQLAPKASLVDNCPMRVRGGGCKEMTEEGGDEGVAEGLREGGETREEDERGREKAAGLTSIT
jgi:hypothetical protein